MWIKCIHSQTVRLFNQNQPGEEIFRGCMMSDQDLEWQWWVLLLPKQSVTKRWYLSTASTETGCLKGKFVYSTVVATLLLNMLLLPGAICSVMSRTALKYLNVWVTVLGEKEHPAWPYCPSFPLHLAKSQHQTGMRTTAATFSEMMCYDNFFFFTLPVNSRCQMLPMDGDVEQEQEQSHERSCTPTLGAGRQMTCGDATCAPGWLTAIIPRVKATFAVSYSSSRKFLETLWYFKVKGQTVTQRMTLHGGDLVLPQWGFQALLLVWRKALIRSTSHTLLGICASLVCTALCTFLSLWCPYLCKENRTAILSRTTTAPSTFSLSLYFTPLAVSMAWAHHKGDRPSALFVFAGRNISSSM